jgi:dipeptidyl aminopeptidase/acylaminoacyl peptidase
MQPEDIRRIAVLEELDLSADGGLAVVARRTIVGNRYVSRLYAIRLDRAAVASPRQLTVGLVRDGQPRIQPNGRLLAFVRSDPRDPDAPAGIQLVPLAGGPPRALGSRGLHGSVGEIAWSPDGRRLAFTAEVDPARFLVGRVPPAGQRQRQRATRSATVSDESPRARRIDRIDWRYDGDGHLDRWSHLFVIDARPGARPRQVTAGDWGVADIAWHPDGRTVAFTADRGPEPDLRPRTTIWAVDVDARAGAASAELKEILAPGGWANHPAYSPSGRWVAAIGVTQPEPIDDISPNVLLARADGSTASDPIDLAPGLDRPIGNWVDTDLTGWMVSGRHGPAWLDDERLAMTVTDRGRSHPYIVVIDPATGAPIERSPSITADVVTHTIAVAKGRGEEPALIAYLGTEGSRAMELHTIDASGGSPRRSRRTTFGSRWQDRFGHVDMRLVRAPGQGGPIDTWVASPAGAGDAALPAVVDVHGGPLGAWAPAPAIEVALLVGRGYRVILPNIRGSASYGRDWIRPQLGDWGGVDAADVHSAVDHVVALGLADPDRLGVLGLSYGGFMVHWLIGTSDRFQAAVSENGVANQVAAWANSDTGPEYDRASLMGDTLSADGVLKLWRQSPLANVADITTPLLMLQAEADQRCPPADNEQLFIALRWLRRTVEYVLYPEESHVYASAGRPDRRIDRMTRMLDWFDRYLQP